MSFRENKLEIAIFTMAFVLVGGLGFLCKSPVQAVLANQDVVYEMPRPKSLLAALFGLTLEDREISRKYVNPFDKKKKEEEKKKKEELAKKAAAKKPTAVAKKTDAKKDDAKKSGKVETRVVGADTKRLGGGDSDFNGLGGSNTNNNRKTAENSSPTDDQKNKMSADQWRALLSAQPTKENVAKLLKAYYEKEIDDTAFYSIVEDLLRNNKTETQALGLYAVSSLYSAKSFSLIAQYYDSMDSSTQSKAQTYLMSYASTSGSAALMAALKSSNTEVVATATQVVLKGYENAKNGVSTGTDPRNLRGDVATSNNNPVANYSKFIPIFQQLAQSHDATVAHLASSALSQIQSGVASL